MLFGIWAYGRHISTMALVLVATLIAVGFGVPLGILAALNEKFIDLLCLF